MTIETFQAWGFFSQFRIIKLELYASISKIGRFFSTSRNGCSNSDFEFSPNFSSFLLLPSSLSYQLRAGSAQGHIFEKSRRFNAVWKLANHSFIGWTLSNLRVGLAIDQESKEWMLRILDGSVGFQMMIMPVSRIWTMAWSHRLREMFTVRWNGMVDFFSDRFLVAFLLQSQTTFPQTNVEIEWLKHFIGVATSSWNFKADFCRG